MVDLNDIKIDLEKITIREYRALFSPSQPEGEGDAVIARCCGISVDELLDLSQPNYRRLIKRFFETARETLADPN